MEVVDINRSLLRNEYCESRSSQGPVIEYNNVLYPNAGGPDKQSLDEAFAECLLMIIMTVEDLSWRGGVVVVVVVEYRHSTLFYYGGGRLS